MALLVTDYNSQKAVSQQQPRVAAEIFYIGVAFTHPPICMPPETASWWVEEAYDGSHLCSGEHLLFRNHPIKYRQHNLLIGCLHV